MFIVQGKIAAAAAAAPEEVTAEDLEAGLPEVEAWRRRAQPQESAAALGTRIVVAFDKLRASAPTGAAAAAAAGDLVPEIDDATVAAALAALEESAGWSAAELALARRVLTGDGAADDDAPAPAPAPKPAVALGEFLPEVEQWRRRALPDASPAELGARLLEAFEDLRNSVPVATSAAADGDAPPTPMRRRRRSRRSRRRAGPRRAGRQPRSRSLAARSPRRRAPTAAEGGARRRVAPRSWISS